ncbi:tRNA pseudouridine synthase B [Caloramator mitchellensis]|uniref:tRNA pseudouridine synthase B n=1 Tax=Caloramator mitchellensis TaxID=908809 RepID=A0A0R3K276_CALMK|nr:tRNA pseudouridine(55) synthase TruB [Caloramator mitchellensis]KRQ86994.1 tRNA pseudouridine synthase B [Caloramator mitchellensis]
MDGVINVLKPPGMTSHDVVAVLRRKLKIKKIGHTGTLDPGAAGVLPVCVGKATKIVEYIQSTTKEYICELTLGNATETYDRYGKFIYENSCDFSNIRIEDIDNVIKEYIGEIEQTPPMYSAIKIEGKRAYEFARKGKTVEMPKRKVIIYSIDVLNSNIPKVMLKVKCSKGTYIRSLCNDIGESLGVHGYMSFLLRTKSGGFNIENAIPLNHIEGDNLNEHIIKIHDALNFPSLIVDSSKSKLILNGNKIKIENKDKLDGLVKIFIESKFVGIGIVEKDILIPEKLFT